MIDPKLRQFLPDLDVEPVRPRAARPDTPPDAAARGTAAPPPLVDGPAEISYVLGSYNRRTLLEKAVGSIRRDCAGRRLEIIVVDGGSTDGAIEWICAQHDLIGIVQHNRYVQDGQTRRRMSWGRFMNIGFRAASAPWIAMISDDCYLLPGSTDAALARATAAAHAGLKVGGCAFYFRNWPQDQRYFVQRTLGGNLMVNHGLYARQALVDVGYANEADYAFYKADTDLSLKIWRDGYVIIDCKEAVCEHFMSPTEAARQSNNTAMDRDRAAMHALWPDLIASSATGKMGPIYLDWTDPENSAERVFGEARWGAMSTAGPS